MSRAAVAAQWVDPESDGSRRVRALEHPTMGGVAMQTSVLITTIACGVFFWTALASGVWKWRAMLAAPDHLAPHYVDTAHRASLLYSFACLVLIHFLQLSPLPEWANVAAAAFPLTFFALAILAYLKLGYEDKTDNQYAHRNVGTTTVTAALAVAEIGGFSVLFIAFLAARLA